MTQNPLVEQLLNYNEAVLYTNAIKDPIVKEISSLALTHLSHEMLKNNTAQLPVAPFDVLYFVKLVEATAEKKGLLQRLLSGESLLWPET